MENSIARLLQLKAQLYALLATLGGLLLIIALLTIRQMEARSAATTATMPDADTASAIDPNDAKAAAGKELFNANCASCHNKNMRDDLTGPALFGVESRWAAYPRKDLYDWVRNSQLMIHTRRHPRAVELWKKWGPTQMNSFPGLTDEQIEQLLFYINYSQKMYIPVVMD